MKYQLVLQLPATSIEDYDAMIELEQALIGSLETSSCVDGHDVGSGEMNIFILTDDPQSAFERLVEVLHAHDLTANLKVAYREIGHDRFHILYPPGLSHFAIA